jgi:hypothetical protein
VEVLRYPAPFMVMARFQRGCYAELELMLSGENMKRWVVALMLCVFVAIPALCFAGDKGTTTVKPDPVIPGSYRVYDNKGQFKQTLKPDPVIPGQYRIEDRKGKPAGFIKPDPVSLGQYRGTPATSPKR